MKKMIELKCKNCSASLNVAENQRFITCEYCGSILERELDYEEQRSMNAQETARKVLKYKEDLAKHKELQEKRRNLEGKIKKDSQMATSNTFTENPLTIAIAIAVLGVFFCIGGITSDISMLYFGIMLLLSAVGTYFWLNYSAKQREVDNERKRRDCEQEKRILENVLYELEELENRFNIDYIPDQYRTDECLNIIYALLASETADTLSAAISQCETELQRRELMKMREQQQKEMEELRTMKKDMERGRSQSAKEKDDDSLVTAGAVMVGAAVLKNVVKDIFDNLDL